jgi:TolB-like protein/Flp pilus assembly protein TadD
VLAPRTSAYEFGPYRVDPLARSLLRNCEVLAVPPKAVEVLVELIKRPGEVIGKKELIEAVWPETFVDEANLNQMIFLLRRALTTREGREYIATVPKRGYRFNDSVHTVEVPYRFEAIAVLPLANLSGDPSQEYFADGVTEALITELAKIASLRVVSRTSAMRYKDTTELIPQIARALRVQAVLEGSVMKSGDRLRITVQLIHAASDQHLWAESYDGTISDILGLQSKVARDVAVGIRAELSQKEEALLAGSRAVHPEAYSLYLNGRFFARQLTDQGQRKAIQYFRESLQIDAGYAAAYAGLAECFIELAYFFGMEPKKAFAEAEPAAVTAVQLDDTLAEGHAVLSLLRLLNDWNWDAADRESQRAIELAPGDPYVYWKRGVYLRYAGRGDEAVAAHRRAESLDPFSLIAIEEVGWPFYYSGRFDEAVDQFRRAVELEPKWDQLYFGLGLALAQQQRYQQAIEAMRTATQLGPDNPFNQASLIYILGRAGCTREAEQLLVNLSSNYSYVPRWFLAIIWVGLNDKERALQALEQAFGDREPCLVSLKVEPIFDPVRDDNRFTDMVRRVGLKP